MKNIKAGDRVTVTGENFKFRAKVTVVAKDGSFVIVARTKDGFDILRRDKIGVLRFNGVHGVKVKHV